MKNTIFFIFIGICIVAMIVTLYIGSGNKASKKAKAISFISFLLIIVVMFSAIFVLYPPKPQSETTTEQTATVETTQAIDKSVTYSEIYKAFKKNEISAQDKYNGNRYQITAEINGMKTGGILGITGGTTLTMEIKVDKTTVFFLASFDEDKRESLKNVSVGDTITFIGTCNDGTFSECELSE